MIEFSMHEYHAKFSDAAGEPIKRVQQVRIDPVTGQQCRITLSRALENERGTQKLFTPPDHDLDTDKCPFCPGNLESATPKLLNSISQSGRLKYKNSVLFPNLFPYTEWSAVSLFDETHHQEIGTATPETYRDCFINCARYLERVIKNSPDAVYMAVTQNHLPGAGGSLVHPHLQVHATKHPAHSHRILDHHTKEYQSRTGRCLFTDLLSEEKKLNLRYLGSTGTWEWMTAFAPKGFYEIWGIAPEAFSLLVSNNEKLWQDLSQGVINTQKFYRSLNRNSYNLALINTENSEKTSCLHVRLSARSSYAPWVRSDFTGFEFGYGEMATFTLPETVAEMAGLFWKSAPLG